MAPCRVFKYYKNIYCSKNLAENPEKFWVEYSNRLVGLGQVASLTKSGQEPAFFSTMWRSCAWRCHSDDGLMVGSVDCLRDRTGSACSRRCLLRQGAPQRMAADLQ